MWQRKPSQKCQLICIGVNSSMSTAEVMDIHHEIVFISSFMVSQLLIRKFTVSAGGDDCPAWERGILYPVWNERLTTSFFLASILFISVCFVRTKVPLFRPHAVFFIRTKLIFYINGLFLPQNLILQ